MSVEIAYEYDAFVSYRRIGPDAGWVQEELVPALERAGLRVMLDVDFVPGRNLLDEIDRAGRVSRRALCIISPDYVDGDRLLHYENQVSRGRVLSEGVLRLIPLILRKTDLPDWLAALVPVDLTNETTRAREWRRLLDALGASDRLAPPPPRLSLPDSPGAAGWVAAPGGGPADDPIPPPRMVLGLRLVLALVGLLMAGFMAVGWVGPSSWRWFDRELVRRSGWTTLVGFSTFLALLTAAWPVHVWTNRGSFTRERFALAGLYTFLAVVAVALVSIVVEEAPWSVFTGVVAQLAGHEGKPSRLGGSGVLSIGFLTYCAYGVLGFGYRMWDGLISLEEQKSRRQGVTSSLFRDAASELPIWLGEKQARKLAIRVAARGVAPPGEVPEGREDWPSKAVQLVGLRHGDYQFDERDGWHDNPQCWVGRNSKTRARVVVHCRAEDPSEADLRRVISYADSLPESRDIRPAAVELMVAVREGRPRDETVDGRRVTIVTECSLLDGLCDFRDYFARVRRRVEKETLPESRLRPADVYVTADYRIWEDLERRSDVESYLDEWLNDPSRRQIALLGEYGQGKSTCSLLYAYHLICREEVPTRVPILIELRGRSPRSMTRRQILGIWADQNRGVAEALELLHDAGRLLVILEGFDEMDLAGDATMRVEHFVSLWRLGGPKAKILITGRPNFFLDNHERDQALRIDRHAAGRAYCEPVYLEPFNVAQMREALRGSDPETCRGICSLAETDAKFHDVVARPSLLYIVSLIWQRERLGERHGRINSAVIMDLFIRQTYARQEEKAEDAPRFMILTGPERAYFMRGVAAYMAARFLPNQMTAEQLDESIELLLNAIPEEVSTGQGPVAVAKPLRERVNESKHGLDWVKNDVRSCGLLVVDLSTSGAFKFAHKSFMEYLIAENLAYEALACTSASPPNDPVDAGAAAAINIASGLDLAHLSFYPESFSFFTELIGASLLPDGVQSLVSSFGVRDTLVRMFVIPSNYFRPQGLELSLLMTISKYIRSRDSSISSGAADPPSPKRFKDTFTSRALTRVMLLERCCRDLEIPLDDRDVIRMAGLKLVEITRRIQDHLQDNGPTSGSR